MWWCTRQGVRQELIPEKSSLDLHKHSVAYAHIQILSFSPFPTDPKHTVVGCFFCCCC